MNLNYPEFLSNEGTESLRQGHKVDGYDTMGIFSDRKSGREAHSGMTERSDYDGKFDAILFNKLSSLEQQCPKDSGKSEIGTGYTDRLVGSTFSPQFYSGKDSFNLPLELQGGIGTISSRRPSYAAESFTRSSAEDSNQRGFRHHVGQNNSNNNSNGNNNNNLASFAFYNNFVQNPYQSSNMDYLNSSFANFNLNANFNDFQSRRPSQLVDFNQSGGGQQASPNILQPPPQSQSQFGQQQLFNQAVKLENGLILKDQYIISSPDLKNLCLSTINYFQDPKLTSEILEKLNKLLTNPAIVKLIQFIKNLNNLAFNHKVLCLVVNKNGKFDLLSYPNNSNICLQKNDLVIVDGDRGKDLVMIVEPLVNLNFAILFNFLKKLEHLKSLTILNEENQNNKAGTHSTLLSASVIINKHSNEDNEFIITLPTKQVLRFATPKEIHKLSGKFLEEKKAFITCYNKIKELKLENDLRLINVEYQSDFKKLIFYYFANFKRIDFRGLIKELFKIYKTRIWLCAVLPSNSPELYGVKPDAGNEKESPKAKDSRSSSTSELEEVMGANTIPNEYELSNDQILNFSINEFHNLASPSYFHSKNLLNLIKFLSQEKEGNFYGFNSGEQNSNEYKNNYQLESPISKNDYNNNGKSIVPNFNPFLD